MGGLCPILGLLSGFLPIPSPERGSPGGRTVSFLSSMLAFDPPAGNEVLYEAIQHLFRRPVSHVLCYDVKRFGRLDNDETGYFRHLLRQAGVEVIYVSGNFSGDDTDEAP